MKFLLIQTLILSVLSPLPAPASPTSVSFNPSDRTLQIRGDTINNAIGYTFTYSNEVGFSRSITSTSNLVSIPCSSQACDQISVFYSYRTNSDSSDNSPISKFFCGNLPSSPNVRPKIVWNSLNFMGFTFPEPKDKGGISISGYRLYMKQTSETAFKLVFDGSNQPYVNYAFISSYNGQSLSNISYDFAYSVLNGQGETSRSPILSVIPAAAPNLDNTIVSGTALQNFQSNTYGILTVSTYDANKNPITTGGLNFMVEILNYCVQNANNIYQCDRVPKTDPKYNADLLGLPSNQIFSDSGNGQYTTRIGFSKPGWITYSIYFLSLGGLRGQYFSSTTLDNTPAQTQIDPQININSSFLGVRWTGGIFPPTSELFKFYVNYGDGIRIWINNALTVDKWDTCCVEITFQVLLTSFSFNDIKIEAKSSKGLSSVKLSWESDSIPKQLIPSNFFYNYNTANKIAYKGIQVTQGPTNNNYDVIIIGSGISGIGSAMTIQNNLNYLILEARERDGGRIWTQNFGTKMVNLGASFVHGASEKNPIYQLVTKFNLSFRNLKKLETRTYYNTNGQSTLYKTKDVENSFNQIIKTAGNVYQSKLIDAQKCKLKEDYSVQEAIDMAIDADSSVKNLLNSDKKNQFYWNLLSWGEEQDESVEYINNSLLRWGNGRRDLPGGDKELELGYGALIDRLIPGLKINRNTEVTSIENYNTNLVTVVTNKGTFTASKVIITVSLGVLKNNQISFVPDLPDWKKGPINRLDMGTLNKVYLQFDKQFWESDLSTMQYFTSEKGEFPWIEVYSPSDKVLIVWLSGKFAEKTESLQDSDIINRILTILKSVYGNTVGTPINHRITRWFSDKYSRGAYSSFTKGSTKSDNDVLGKSVQNLHFCGEATNKDFLGTVHGAYISGQRAANEILNPSTPSTIVSPPNTVSTSNSSRLSLKSCFSFFKASLTISLVILVYFF